MSTKQIPSPVSLVECFVSLPDPRVERTRAHRLIDIMVIGFCATLAGGEGFNDMEFFGRQKEPWLRTFLELPNGIPTHDTFNRVFQAIDPEAFMECFVRWTQGLRERISGEIVAVDGKALRRALDKGRKDPLPYIVSARVIPLRLLNTTITRQSKRITDGSRPAASGRAPIRAGLPIVNSGRGSKASGPSSLCAISTAR